MVALERSGDPIHGGFGKIQGCTNIMFYACMLLLLYSVLRLIVVE
jgi:hypothetical protein